jgi:hypothetical protein
MPITKTYAVSQKGFVKRLDNLTGSWIDISITSSFPSAAYNLNDVETDPLNGNKVFVVGGGSVQNNVFGIYVSNDAGVTWNIPSGSYQTNYDAFGAIVWNEIYVLDSLNIYVAGNNGFIAISNDGGLTFELSSLLPPILPNSDAYSVHFVTPTIGVVGLYEYVALTTDGGVTWSLLNSGNPLSGPGGNSLDVVGIHMSADQQTIIAMGQGRIFRSTDAGSTFTEVLDLIRTGEHLTWINDQELWAFCRQNKIFKTIDAGATWITVQPTLFGGVDHKAGHFYFGQQGFYSNDNDVVYTNDGGYTSTLSTTFPYRVKALWTNYQPDPCYTLTLCEDQECSFTVYADLADKIGKSIKLCNTELPCYNNDCSCYAISEGPSTKLCCWTIEIVNYNFEFQIIINGDTYSSSPLGLLAWLNGLGLGVFSVTYLSEYAQLCVTGNEEYGDISIIPVIAPLAEPGIMMAPPSPETIVVSPLCNTINLCQDAIVLDISQAEFFDTCVDCVGKCYLFTNCESEETFITSTDFSQYDGQVVTISTCPDECWQVSLVELCSTIAPASFSVVESYVDCEACLYTPPPPPVGLIQRKVKPGYGTPGCSPEYTEMVTCKYGETMFDQMAVDRYGITICCDHDVEKWDIQKRILDLKAIYDPAWEVPLSKICYCYSITQTANTVTYTYINCEGSLTTLILNAGDNANICSQSYPRACCPPEGSVYEIVKSTTVCTTNADCVPNCFCYTIEPAKEGVLYSYHDCNTNEYLEKITLVTTSICAIENTVTIISGIGTITNVGDCNAPECAN